MLAVMRRYRLTAAEMVKRMHESRVLPERMAPFVAMYLDRREFNRFMDAHVPLRKCERRGVPLEETYPVLSTLEVRRLIWSFLTK